MKFRRGGRLARSDAIRLNGELVEFVNQFTYLGIELTPSVRSPTAHINERVRKAILAGLTITNPQLLSLDTALKLFDIKVGPIATYGIDLMWNNLTILHLKKIEKVKSLFVKRALCVARTTLTRLAYKLAGCKYFIMEIKDRFGLPETPGFIAFTQEVDRKTREIADEFYSTQAMTSQRWKEPLQTARHITTREAVHGFHHAFCTRGRCFQPNEECACRFCGAPCARYHYTKCGGSPSLRQLSSEYC